MCSIIQQCRCSCRSRWLRTTTISRMRTYLPQQLRLCAKRRQALARAKAGNQVHSSLCRQEGWCAGDEGPLRKPQKSLKSGEGKAENRSGQKRGASGQNRRAPGKIGGYLGKTKEHLGKTQGDLGKIEGYLRKKREASRSI